MPSFRPKSLTIPEQASSSFFLRWRKGCGRKNRSTSKYRGPCGCGPRPLIQMVGFLGSFLRLLAADFHFRVFAPCVMCLVVDDNAGYARSPFRPALGGHRLRRTSRRVCHTFFLIDGFFGSHASDCQLLIATLPSRRRGIRPTGTTLIACSSFRRRREQNLQAALDCQAGGNNETFFETACPAGKWSCCTPATR